MKRIALALLLTACGTDHDSAPACAPAETEIASLTLDPGIALVFADTTLSNQCDGVTYAAVYAVSPGTEPATCMDGTKSVKAGAKGFINSLIPNTKYFMRACVLLPTGELSKGIAKEFTTKAAP